MRKKYIKSIAILVVLLVVNSAFSQKKKLLPSKNESEKVEFQLTEENKRSLEKTGFVRCLTVENEQSLLEKYPNRPGTEAFENWLAPKIAQFKKDRKSGKVAKSAVIFNIPVVVHIIHNGDPVNTPGNIYGENISDAQAISQIQVLNEDYRRMNGTNGGANTTGLAVDVEINFCLAVQDPNGYPTSGVVRHNITPYSNNEPDADNGGDWETKTDVETMKAATQWDPTKYLNMWSIKPGGKSLQSGGLTGLLGYAQFPTISPFLIDGLNNLGGSANTDGVVAGYNAFGTIANDDGSFIMNGTYNLGRTMTHEVGHWLGLRHTWGDGNCSVDDYCDDTPLTGSSNYGCDLLANTCPEPFGEPEIYDMVQNYMDYTDDSCMDTFTQDQKDRMVIVMQNSARRVELNTSTGCDAVTVPYILFNETEASVAEDTSCGYKDILVQVNIIFAPAEDAIVTFSKSSGTATEGVDFDFVNSSVTFLAGQTASKTLTLRIYEDSFEELDETLTIGMSVSTTGDAEIIGNSNNQFNVTILDDDVRLSGFAEIFGDDFESYTNFETGNVGGWTSLDGDGLATYVIQDVTFDNQGYTGAFIVFNASQTVPETTSTWGAHGGNKGYYCFNNNTKNDDYIFTPQLNLNGTGAELKFWAKSYTDTYGLEKFNVLVSTTDTNAASFTRVLPTIPTAGLTYEEPPTTWTEYTYDLSVYDGQQIFIAFHVVSEDAFAFMLDDVSVKTNIALEAQTAVNTPDQNALASSGTIFANNDVTNNLVVDITNSNNQNYGCVDAYVSRAFEVANPAVQEQASGVENYVLAKKFTITPSVINSSGNAELVFYFNEQEIQLWETTTGNNRSQLVVYKDNGSTIEQVPLTIGAFGNNVTLTANYTTGINGTYFFGTSNVLSISENEFNNFGVYPNPSSSNFNITLSASEDVKLAIFDMLGRKVFENKYQNTSSNFNTEISPKLTKGVYILKVESGGRKASRKIIIE